MTSYRASGRAAASRHCDVTPCTWSVVVVVVVVGLSTHPVSMTAAATAHYSASRDYETCGQSPQLHVTQQFLLILGVVSCW